MCSSDLAFAASYVYANLLGNEAGRAIYDGGVIVASAGRIVASGRRFSFADHAVTTAVIDVDATRLAQARLTASSVLPSARSAFTAANASAPFRSPSFSAANHARARSTAASERPSCTIARIQPARASARS